MNKIFNWGDTRLKSALWAMMGLIILFFWDLAIVKSNYGGNWTSLFRTGDYFPVPSMLRENTYIFSNSPGYDGQFYRYLAHDPFWIDHNLASFDSLPRRYPRILVPLTAYLLASGNQNLIDFTYFATISLLIFIGGFWLSQWATSNGRTAAWGLAFAVLPSSVISATMMTVDIGILAFSIGLGHYMEKKRYVPVYILVMLSSLCSETGMLLLAGVCLWLLMNKKWRLTLLVGTSGLPAVGWYVYVQAIVRAATGGSAIPEWLMEQPITGIFRSMAAASNYNVGPYLNKLIGVFDLLSLGAMILAFLLIGLAILRKPLSPIALIGSLFIVLAIVVNNSGFWAVPIGYLRPFSVLLGFLLMLSLSGGLKQREVWVSWVSISITSLRIISQFIYTEFLRAVC